MFVAPEFISHGMIFCLVLFSTEKTSNLHLFKFIICFSCAMEKIFEKWNTHTITISTANCKMHYARAHYIYFYLILNHNLGFMTYSNWVICFKANRGTFSIHFADKILKKMHRFLFLFLNNLEMKKNPHTAAKKAIENNNQSGRRGKRLPMSV